jgi:hypothetical protein
MTPYGRKIRGGCRCCPGYNSKNKGKTPKKRERQHAKKLERTTNELTSRTLRKTDCREEIVESKNAEIMFRKLGLT